jgi:hypothetical protein
MKGLAIAGRHAPAMVPAFERQKATAAPVTTIHHQGRFARFASSAGQSRILLRRPTR